jgi:radical SAM enzyme (TIGR01210 family)
MEIRQICRAADDRDRGLDRQAVIDRVTGRAWRDDAFRRLLFERPAAALQDEFGLVPRGFETASFRQRDVDRLISRHRGEARHVTVRSKPSDEPLSVVARQMLGVPELIVVLYTRRCAYQCSFCTLPLTSALTDVSFADIRRQLDLAMAFAHSTTDEIRQVSLCNEGSMLDASTVPREQLEYLVRSCCALPGVQDIVLETRPEFATESLVDDLLRWAAPAGVTLKIGLESADEHIRQNILRKRMDLAQFESVVRMLARKDVGLATYVLVKADPTHTDAQGRADAVATCGYLKALCRGGRPKLTLRVNPMYRAAGSWWAKQADKAGWTPPSIFDVAEVMRAALADDVRVFAGLSEEGQATEDGHYEARADFERWAYDAMTRFNWTGDVTLLDAVARHRGGGMRAR